MTIEVDRNFEGEKIPKITYETGFKIKENGFKSRNVIQNNFIADIDDEGNVLLKKDNEQQEIDEKGNMIIEKENENESV